MHESIAKAVRRGDNRRIYRSADGYWNRVLACHTQERRGPWYRYAVEFLRSDPAGVAVWEGESGRGKHRVFEQLALVQDEDRRWSLVVREVEARAFLVRSAPLPIEVSDHVIDRLLQRLGVGSVREALTRLRPAVLLTLRLMADREAPFLAPVTGGGAVIVVPTNRSSDGWCLITYVADHQLRAEQRRELAANEAAAAQIDRMSPARQSVPEILVPVPRGDFQVPAVVPVLAAVEGPDAWGAPLVPRAVRCLS